MQLTEQDRAELRTFIASTCFRNVHTALLAARPPIGEFINFKSDRQFDVSIGVLKGWEDCLSYFLNLSDSSPQGNPTDVQSIDFNDKEKGKE